MRVTVTTMTGRIANLDVSEDLDLKNFKGLIEGDLKIPTDRILLIFDGQECRQDDKTLKDYGIKDGECVFIQELPPPPKPASGPLQLPDFGQIRVPKPGGMGPGPSTRPREDDPAVIREMLKANPDQMALLKQNNPRLAEALESGSLEEFSKVLKEQQEVKAERERQRLRMLTADPMDMEAQRLIAQEIENKNIEQNMELAMEYNPESFGTVVMLYIDCKVNGHHIKAFVDSGAQATIMSQVKQPPNDPGFSAIHLTSFFATDRKLPSVATS